ncbi:MAG: hypothetical protein J3T61_10665, partial [Candidatus Brocadiales bacterium]|nr:hypothetical protein [Candidatus Bathyanammoxibius sp.]
LVGIHDEPTRCYRINLEWTPLVTGMIGLLAETRMWKDVYTKDAFPIQQILNLLEGEDCDLIDCTALEICLQTSDIINQIVAVTYATQEAATQAHIDALALA